MVFCYDFVTGLCNKIIMKAYFDLVYSYIYDFTTSGNSAYRKQQENCIDKLELVDGDKLLCIGVGTGNELKRILNENQKVKIAAVDQSITALNKAGVKTGRYSENIELHLMDARSLKFEDASFNKVLCIHVMEFIKESQQATEEIVRVLKKGGRFVITYPAYMEGPALGMNLLRANLQTEVNSFSDRISLISKSVARIIVGLLYIPLLFRKKRKPYSRNELEQMFEKVTAGNLIIEEDTTYQDYIVYGNTISPEAVDA